MNCAAKPQSGDCKMKKIAKILYTTSSIIGIASVFIIIGAVLQIALAESQRGINGKIISCPREMYAGRGDICFAANITGANSISTYVITFIDGPKPEEEDYIYLKSLLSSKKEVDVDAYTESRDQSIIIWSGMTIKEPGKLMMRAFVRKGSCVSEVGTEKAHELATQCLNVSPATHPPCSEMNECLAITKEITRGCEFMKSTSHSARDMTIPEYCQSDSDDITRAEQMINSRQSESLNKIDGYRDFKFGMSYKDVDSTAKRIHCNGARELFFLQCYNIAGILPSIEFEFTGPGDGLSMILLGFGAHNDDFVTSVANTLRDKYGQFVPPTDLDISRFNSYQIDNVYYLFAGGQVFVRIFHKNVYNNYGRLVSRQNNDFVGYATTAYAKKLFAIQNSSTNLRDKF